MCFRGGVDGTVIFGEYSKNQIPGRVHHVPLVPASLPVKTWIIRVERTSQRSWTPAPLGHIFLHHSSDRLFSAGDISCDAMQEMPKLIVNLHKLHLSWYAKQYIIQLDTALCQPAIQAIPPAMPVEAILGLSFLRHHVTVFDVDNARVGFSGIV
ncbi:hypothetical protein X801_07572 [Opisthorchis viverrini]|uniref:Peptidase A1 domain-containing protein n=1 Tax=Opisthorchis viverrini TaxID=6198 RepID=A0A1S8WQB0_OPIVI|nr:hypothetical protein X801_07572 [Opisthorchis viverrini]